MGTAEIGSAVCVCVSVLVCVIHKCLGLCVSVCGSLIQGLCRCTAMSHDAESVGEYMVAVTQATGSTWRWERSFTMDGSNPVCLSYS